MVDPPGRVVVVGTNVVPGDAVVVGPVGTLVPGEAVVLGPPGAVVVGHGPMPPPGIGHTGTVVVVEPEAGAVVVVAPTVVVPVVTQPSLCRREEAA